MLNIYFFLFCTLFFPLPDLFLYPRMRRAADAGVPGARTRYYLTWIVLFWLLAGGAVAVALRGPQPWSVLRLTFPSMMRLAAGSALVIAYAALAMKQRRSLVANPERLRKVMRKFPTTEALTPHTAAETKTFALFAVSAGVSEEVVYRGFMLWLATSWIGLWPGLLLTSVLFGLAHSYLGPRQVVRTGIGGAIFGVLTIVSASLWPAVVLHAFVDLLSGDLGYRALRAGAGSQPALGAAESRTLHKSEPLEQVRDERLREAIGNGADGAALLIE